MKAHKLCQLFPEMDESAFTSLKESIAERGLEDPIILFDDQILDGRNRWKACKQLRIEPKTKEYRGKDPLGFVVAKNLERRHLDESQRAMVAAKIEGLKWGGDRKSKNQDLNLDLERGEAAGRTNVSVASVAMAKKVLAEGSPDLIRAVETGKIAVSAAKSLVALPDVEQSTIALEPDIRERRKKVSEGKKRAKHYQKPTIPKAKNLELTSPSNGTATSFWTIEAWGALPPKDRERIIEEGFESSDTMNAQDTTSIEWALHSLNTVTGCLHDCPYCYARDIAERFFSYKFKPVFHPNRLAAPANTKFSTVAASKEYAFRNIFANSMSDLFGKWVPKEWIESTIEMARRNPEWNFLTLTKFPRRAADFEYPDNLWLGTSVDAQSRVKNAEEAFRRVECKTKWLSLEPLLEPLEFSDWSMFQWVVVGGASKSNKTPEWFPPFAWVSKIHAAAKEAGCKVYHKTNLGLYDSVRVREFPWEKTREKQLPKVFKYLKGMK